MKYIGRYSLLRWIALGLFVSAVLLSVFQLVVFSRLRSSYAAGTMIAGVDVTGLDQGQAAARITQVYSMPVELRYDNSKIHIKPNLLGFSIDLAAMMTAADQTRVSQPFWTAFLEYLFNQLPASSNIPLRVDIDENRLRDYLVKEIAARYDQDATPYTPLPGSVVFDQGNPGRYLDVEKSVLLISTALRSPDDRVAILSVNQGSSARPSLQNLQVLLQQIIDVNEFGGEVELYMQDLGTGNELQFAYRAGDLLVPEIAFSAESTIKIAIMVAAYQRVNEPTPTEIVTAIQDMIARSDNVATDDVMIKTMSPTLGPLEVSQTMRDLGFKNTFLDGMFYLGAPLLTGVTTPANSRTDVFTEPDPYNQTTPTEIGQLLVDIYHCAQSGSGSFAAVFPGKLSQNECKSMVTYLTENRIGVLLEAGLPEGTQIGHKHGWATDPADGVMHVVGDAGLVYSPGGDYVLTIYTHDDDQIVWDAANQLFADLSRAVYNYFNIVNQ